MGKVIRLNKILENLIEDMKTEYILFYKNTAKTKNSTLKSMAEKELKRAESYNEKDWIQYALYRELQRLEDDNK